MTTHILYAHTTRFIRRRREGVWHFCTNFLGYREALNRGLKPRRNP